MRYAIPTVQGKLALHFGHCETFVFVDVTDGEIAGTSEATAPSHAPGALPKWLGEQGVDVVIAGGMGRRAQSLFQQAGIEVVIGAPMQEPAELVRSYLAGQFQAGENICDH